MEIILIILIVVLWINGAALVAHDIYTSDAVSERSIIVLFIVGWLLFPIYIFIIIYSWIRKGSHIESEEE